MQIVLKNLFPEIQTFNQGLLNTDNSHQIYYEECGNPNGYPVIFLHGGPGSGCNPSQRRFFDPDFYRIILFDQRGCGRSLPLGETQHNTTQDLIADMELIRTQLNISQWLVFGGSWGSTLALAYALAHQAHVSGLILRGIFLSRAEEIEWFLHDARQFYPENWQQLVSFLPEQEQSNLLEAYASRIFNSDPAIAAPAAKQWNTYESSILTLLPRAPSDNAVSDQIEIARARVQIHYIKHLCFVDGHAILQKAERLNSLPIHIVQGRYDMVCPPVSAWELSQRLPQAALTMVADAGHSAMEAGITSALVGATEQFKAYLKKS